MNAIAPAQPATSAPPTTRLMRELERALERLEAEGLRRRLMPLERLAGAAAWLDGRRVVSWCSNDYLGLSTHPALAAAAAQAGAEWGIGARASRLLFGTTPWHLRLETRLASWLGLEAAVVFPSGYLANIGALGALLGPGDLALVDRLAHASLVDAVRASRATLRVFRHNDPSHVAILLSRAGAVRRRVIVTEGVFSMEGDRAPLAPLLEVAERHGALVYLDDAHGVFVLGASGRGAPDAAGVPHERLLYMGALGKALGCQGGFIAGPRPLIEYLQNRARTFIYTTALAVPVAAAGVAALDVLTAEPQRRARFQGFVLRGHARLAASGFPVRSPPSHIAPLIVGGAMDAARLSQRLLERRVFAPPIRPPTVPRGTARVRLSFTLHHTDADLEALVEALEAGGCPRG